jgi:cobalt-zinc-cadmium efflux system outer membrane protein
MMLPNSNSLLPWMIISMGMITIAGASQESGPDGAGQEARTSVNSYSDASDPQLRNLIEILLRENPEIRSSRARVRSLSARVAQAGSLPDPQLSFRYFAQSPETRVGPQEQGLEISQRIPWKGKRGLQSEREEYMALSSAWSSQEIERNLVADLKRTYFQSSYLQEAIAINSEERDLLRRFESIALKRYATGEGIQQSVVKVQTDITRLDDLETALQERLDSASRRIAELIGRPSTEMVLASITVKITQLKLEPDALEDTAESHHPRIHAFKQRINADRVWSQRRALESRPDFRFGLGYTMVDDRQDLAGRLLPPEENGKDIVAFTVGINIPLYRTRIRAGIEEAEQSRQSNEERLSSIQNHLRYQIQESILRLESLEERGKLYRAVLIPQAEESLASSEAAYTTGRQNFLDLLDAERVLFQVRLTYHRLVSDYWIAMTDLELGIGDRFPRDGTSTSTSLDDTDDRR